MADRPGNLSQDELLLLEEMGRRALQRDMAVEQQRQATFPKSELERRFDQMPLGVNDLIISAPAGADRPPPSGREPIDPGVLRSVDRYMTPPPGVGGDTSPLSEYERLPPMPKYGGGMSRPIMRRHLAEEAAPYDATGYPSELEIRRLPPDTPRPVLAGKEWGPNRPDDVLGLMGAGFMGGLAEPAVTWPAKMTEYVGDKMGLAPSPWTKELAVSPLEGLSGVPARSTGEAYGRWSSELAGLVGGMTNPLSVPSLGAGLTRTLASRAAPRMLGPGTLGAVGSKVAGFAGGVSGWVSTEAVPQLVEGKMSVDEFLTHAVPSGVTLPVELVQGLRRAHSEYEMATTPDEKMRALHNLDTVGILIGGHLSGRVHRGIQERALRERLKGLDRDIEALEKEQSAKVEAQIAPERRGQPALERALGMKPKPTTEKPDALQVQQQEQARREGREVEGTPQGRPTEVPTGKEQVQGQVTTKAPTTLEGMRQRGQDMMAKAEERIKKLETKVTSGLDPAKLAAYAQWGAGYALDTGLRYAQWAKGMVQRFGKEIRPHLKGMWEHAQKVAHRKGLPSTKEVIRRVSRTQSPKDAPPDVVFDQLKKAYRKGAMHGAAGERSEMSKKLPGIKSKAEQRGYGEGYFKGMKDAFKGPLPEALERKLSIKSKKELQATQKDLIEAAREVLPKEELHRVINAINRSRTVGQVKLAQKAIAHVGEILRHRGAVQDWNKAVKEAKEVVNKSKERRARPIREVMEAVASTRPKAKTLRKAQKVLDFAGRDEMADIAPQIPKEIVDNARRILSQKPDLRGMKAEEVEQITYALKAMTHAAKNEGMLAGKLRATSVATARGHVVTDIRSVRGSSKWNPSNLKEGVKRRQPDLWRFLTADRLNYETRIINIAGEESKAYNILYQHLWDGYGESSKWELKAGDYVREALKDVPFSVQKRMSRAHMGNKVKTLTVPTPGATTPDGRPVHSVKMTEAELLTTLALMRDPSTYKELARNRGPAILTETARLKGDMEGFKPTVETMRSMMRSLTPVQKKILEAGRHVLNDMLGPEADKVSERLHGVPLRSDASGDRYFPRRRYRGARELMDPKDVAKEHYAELLAHQGFTKTRTGGKDPIYVRDYFQVLKEAITREAEFIGKSEPAENAARILNDKQVKEAVRDRYKNWEQIVGDLQGFVRDYRMLEYNQLTPFERWLSRAKRRATVAILGFQPQIPMYQPLSYLGVLTYMPVKHWAKLWNLRPPWHNRTMGEIKKYDPILRARLEAHPVSVVTPSASSQTLKHFYTGKDSYLDAMGMGGIRALDKTTIMMIWNNSKAWAKADGFKGEALMEETSRRAQMLVRRTQPSYDNLSISKVALSAKKSPALGFFVMFRNQLDKYVNMLAREVSRVNREPSAENVGRLARSFLVTVALPTTAVYFMRKEWYAAVRGRKEDETVGDDIIGVIANALGTWAIGGDIIGQGMKTYWNMHRGKYIPHQMRGNPVTEAVWDIMNATAYAIEFAGDGFELKRGWQYKLERALSGLGVFGGIPLRGMFNVGRAAYRGLTGEELPTGKSKRQQSSGGGNPRTVRPGG